MPPSRKHVIVIDDSPSIIAFCGRALELGGFEVSAFTDPLAAISAIKATGVDLILSDYNMPGASGAVVMLSAQEVNPEIPFILMSTELLAVPDWCLDRALHVHVLSKPFSEMQLVTMARLLTRVRPAMSADVV